MRSHIRETYIIILRKMSHISAYETILKNNNHMWTYKTILYLQAICHHINSYCAYDLYVDIWSYIAQFDNAHYKPTCSHVASYCTIWNHFGVSNHIAHYQIICRHIKECWHYDMSTCEDILRIIDSYVHIWIYSAQQSFICHDMVHIAQNSFIWFILRNLGPFLVASESIMVNECCLAECRSNYDGEAPSFLFQKKMRISRTIA